MAPFQGASWGSRTRGSRFALHPWLLSFAPPALRTTSPQNPPRPNLQSEKMAMELIRRLAWPGRADPDAFLSREWLVTNGLGGYASGSVGGAATRRYHA